MPRPYDHFRRDAIHFIRQNRDWSSNQAQNTISTLWAADDAVRGHYVGSADQDQSPGLPAPNPIPTIPCTRREADDAKKNGRLPGRLQGVQQPGGQPQGGQPPIPQPLIPQPPIPQLPIPQPPIAQAPIPQVPFPQAPMPQPTVPQAPVQQPPVQPVQQQPPQQPVGDKSWASSHADRVPYHYWPQPPWNVTEHDLHVPTTSTIEPSRDEQEEWLGGRPYFPEEFSEDEAMWHGLRHLGGGGYGIVGLWVKTDAANNVERRMVIKDSVPSSQHWRDPHNWRDRVPREVRVHQIVEERRSRDPETCRHLIRYFGYRLHMAQRIYRLYLEYYSSGTLFGAYWIHHQYWNRKEDALKNPEKGRKPRKEPAPQKPDPVTIPEAFIWSVIKALASACLVLQTGTDQKTPDPNVWRPITHLDIQNQNVFLQLHVDEPEDDPSDSNDGGPGPMSPKRKRGGSVSRKGKEPVSSATGAKRQRTGSAATTLLPILGDFGLSALSPDANDKGYPLEDNPDNYIWRDRLPQYPPEQQFQISHSERLGVKTDVWSIGNIAWQMIVNRTTSYGPVREDVINDITQVANYEHYIPIASWGSDGQAMNRAPHTANSLLSGRYFPASANYSETLKSLVRTCLDWETRRRPHLHDVHDAAIRALEEDEDSSATLSNTRGLGLDVEGEDESRIVQPAPPRRL